MTTQATSIPPQTPPVRVQHAWPLRVLRTLQFGWARLANRDGYVNARAAPFGSSFTGPSRDVITRHIYRLGAHEPAITRYLLENVRLQSGDVAFDIGANLGWYSVLLSRLSAPGAQVFAFEPDPESYRLLTINLTANAAGNVTACNVALGETAGVAELHRYKASNNGRHTLLSGNTGGGTVRVPVDTLAAFWERQALGDRPIRVVKIDVEGFEYFVLRGAGELLTRCACLVLEYSPDSFPVAGLKAQLLLDLLAATGFKPHAFERDGPVPVTFDELAAATLQRDLLLTRASGRT